MTTQKITRFIGKLKKKLTATTTSGLLQVIPLQIPGKGVKLYTATTASYGF